MDKIEWEQQKNKSKEIINNKKTNPRKKYTDDDVRLIITNIDKYNKSISDCNKDVVLNSVTLACALFLLVFNSVLAITNGENRISRLFLGATFAIVSALDIKTIKDKISTRRQRKQEYQEYLDSFDLELVEKPERIVKRK